MSAFPTTANSMASMLASSQIAPASSGAEGGKAFMNFDSKSGVHAFGKMREDITDEIVVVNLSSFSHGWTLWSNGKPTKVAASFTAPLPEPMAAIGNDHPSEARSFEARFEDDADTVLLFATNTYGGRKGCDTLLDIAKIRALAGETEFLYPVVKLSSENYVNVKQGGALTYNPKFEVIDWANQEGDYESDTPKLEAAPKVAGDAQMVAEEAEVVEAPAKKKRTRKARA